MMCGASEVFLKPVDLIIFDLDGTLADTKEDIATAVNLTFAELGLPQVPREMIYTYVGDGVKKLIERAVFQVHHENAFDRALTVFQRHYMTHLLDTTRFYPGMDEVLDHYGHKTLAVVTNKPIDYTEKLLRGLKQERRFAAVLGGDSTPHLKPHPGMILKILEMTGIGRGAAVMVGDMPNDVRAARAAGICVCGIGYGLGDPEAVRRESPDYFAEKVSDLLTLFV